MANGYTPPILPPKTDRQTQREPIKCPAKQAAPLRWFRLLPCHLARTNVGAGGLADHAGTTRGMGAKDLLVLNAVVPGAGNVVACFLVSVVDNTGHLMCKHTNQH